MIVDKIANSTTRESAVYYTITMRVWSAELKTAGDDSMLAEQLATVVRRAIEGIE